MSGPSVGVFLGLGTDRLLSLSATDMGMIRRVGQNLQKPTFQFSMFVLLEGMSMAGYFEKKGPSEIGAPNPSNLDLTSELNCPDCGTCFFSLPLRIPFFVFGLLMVMSDERLLWLFDENFSIRPDQGW